MKEPTVGIITINYNETDVTCELLESIQISDYKVHEIIVVDNNSKENPAQIIHAKFPDVKVILSEENLGFAGGNNLGIHQMHTDYIFFVNNDAIINSQTIGKLVQSFKDVPNLGAISPIIYHYSKDPTIKRIQFAGTTEVNRITGRNITLKRGELDTGQLKKYTKTAHLHGAAMMISKAVIEKVGLMPENYFLYYEELDWSETLKRNGYVLLVNTEAQVMHKESHSIGEDSLLKTYYINRNRIIFMKRNQSLVNLLGFYLFIFIFTIPKQIFKYLIHGKFEHIKVYLSAIKWNFTNPKFRKVKGF